MRAATRYDLSANQHQPPMAPAGGMANDHAGDPDRYEGAMMLLLPAVLSLFTTYLQVNSKTGYFSSTQNGRDLGPAPDLRAAVDLLERTLREANGSTAPDGLRASLLGAVSPIPAAPRPRLIVDNTAGLPATVRSTGGTTDGGINVTNPQAAAPASEPGNLFTIEERENHLHPAFWVEAASAPSRLRIGHVFISFSAQFEADTKLVMQLRQMLEARLVHNGFPRPYVFTDRTGGLSYGDLVVPQIVEAIRDASAAFVVQSFPYFASEACRLEFSLLMLRKRLFGIPVYQVYGGETGFERETLRIPMGSEGAYEEIVPGELGDDRKMHPAWLPQFSAEPLETLQNRGESAAITRRLRAMVDDLMGKLAAKKGDDVT